MSLKNAFRKAAAQALVFGAGLTGCAAHFAERPAEQAAHYDLTVLCDSPDGPVCARPLTAGEDAFVRSVFGETVDTSRVWLRFVEQEDAEGRAAIATKAGITFFGRKHWSCDYAQESSLFRFGMFIHEITHVFEGQNPGVIGNERDRCATYDYDLSPGARLTDFCIEQRASIVEDYARCFLHPEGGAGYVWGCGAGDAEKDARIAQVVEQDFPAAKTARVAAKKPPLP